VILVVASIETDGADPGRFGLLIWHHPELPGRRLRLAYCLNLHPAEDLAGVLEICRRKLLGELFRESVADRVGVADALSFDELDVWRVRRPMRDQQIHGLPPGRGIGSDATCLVPASAHWFGQSRLGGSASVVTPAGSARIPAQTPIARHRTALALLHGR